MQSAVHTGDENRIVIIEVNDAKDNTEIVGWRYAGEKQLKELEKQAKREGGRILILPSESEEAGGLSSRTSSRSDSKDTKEIETSTTPETESAKDVEPTEEEKAKVQEQQNNKPPANEELTEEQIRNSGFGDQDVIESAVDYVNGSRDFGSTLAYNTIKEYVTVKYGFGKYRVIFVADISNFSKPDRIDLEISNEKGQFNNIASLRKYVISFGGHEIGPDGSRIDGYEGGGQVSSDEMDVRYDAFDRRRNDNVYADILREQKDREYLQTVESGDLAKASDILVHSDNVKNWFGDWEKTSVASRLKALKPIDSSKYKMNGTPEESYLSIGSATNKADKTTVKFDHDAYKKGYKAVGKFEAAIPALKDIF